MPVELPGCIVAREEAASAASRACEDAGWYLQVYHLLGSHQRPREPKQASRAGTGSARDLARLPEAWRALHSLL